VPTPRPILLADAASIASAEAEADTWRTLAVTTLDHWQHFVIAWLAVSKFLQSRFPDDEHIGHEDWSVAKSLEEKFGLLWILIPDAEKVYIDSVTERVHGATASRLLDIFEIARTTCLILPNGWMSRRLRNRLELAEASAVATMQLRIAQAQSDIRALQSSGSAPKASE